MFWLEKSKADILFGLAWSCFGWKNRKLEFCLAWLGHVLVGKIES
jgi:hypothetical protein